MDIERKTNDVKKEETPKEQPAEKKDIAVEEKQP